MKKYLLISTETAALVHLEAAKPGRSMPNVN
jgi:hypothetical protein